MSRRFPEREGSTCFFVTSTFRNWNAYGQVTGFYEAQVKSLVFCLERYSALMLGYVLMPSHVHLLLIIDGTDLPKFMRDFKKYIAQKVAADLKLTPGGIWMPRYDRVSINSLDTLLKKMNYIHMNPVKGELVKNPIDWKWSSARDYLLGEKGSIPIYKEWG